MRPPAAPSSSSARIKIWTGAMVCEERTEPGKMTAPARFILVVIAVVCAAGALMVPGRDEWLAMMRDEDKQAQRIALLATAPGTERQRYRHSR